MSDRPVRGTPLRVLLAMLAGLFCLCAQALPQPLELDKLQRLTAAEASVVAVLKGFDTVKRETVYELLVANVSATALHAPLYVTVEGLNKPGVTLKNPSGTTTSGVPYFVMSTTDVPAGAKVTLAIRFGNPLNAPFTFTTVGYATPQTQVPALQVEITQPPTLITVGSTPLPVAGTINDASATLTLNGAPISHSGGTFHANVALTEGHNAIIARAVNGRGEEATATISVSLDMTPPYVTIESPADGAVLSEGVINVSGLINDIVRGTVSEGQAQVTVNGRPATVANRSYLATGIALTEGPNTILVEASDQVGNTGTTQIHVTYVVPTGAHLELVSGQGQHAQIRTELAQPLAVKLLDTNSQPVTGKPVVFRVSQDDGVVGAGRNDEGPAVLVNTDGNGIASTRYRLGARAGSGNQHVTAKAVGFEGEVVFVASATPKPGNKVSVNSGNNQRGSPNQSLPLPFVVVVTDDGANVIEGAQVEFTVSAGSGTFQNGQAHIRATTDSDGRASAKLTLGSQVGLDVHRVTATLVDTQLEAGFTASALQSGPPGQTSISGVVLDNQDHPLPNVTLRVEGTTREAKTDAQGRFKITEAPVGPVHLIADGSTTTVPGEWPTLPYNIVTVSGADNPLSSPVYLVKLDTAHAVTVGAQDTEVTLPEVPGFKLTVKAGSVTFPNGDRVGQLSVTPVNVSKIPMAPPNGMQPQFIVTIQPAGARFDPPAPLQLPNVDGHAPGAQVEMYSFDHDLEEFVSIGLGTVSTDGTTIASNPGIGVIKAGWHCGSQPGGSGCVASPPLCQRVTNCSSPAQNDDSDLRIIFADVPHDCQKPECHNGSVEQVPNPLDDPPDTSKGDCKKPQCLGPDVNDDTDDPANNCTACKNGAPVDITITNAAAIVEGQVAAVGLMKNGVATFAFEGSAVSELCTDLKYNWEFGDGATGFGAHITHGYTGNGDYTVTLTVSCGNCLTKDETTTAQVTVLELVRRTVALTPANRQRTKIAVGEEVEFEVVPARNVFWSVTGGGTLSSGSGPNTMFSADYVATTSKVKVDLAPLIHETVDLTVVEPEIDSMKQVKTSAHVFPPGRQGAGMTMDIFFKAVDVSFYKIEVQEQPNGPTGVEGYFLQFVGGTLLDHTPSGIWCGFRQDNKSFCTDNASSLSGGAAPYIDGKYDWLIPNHFQKVGDTPNGTFGNGKFFTNVLQQTRIEGPPNDGRTTESKGGDSVTRSP